MKHKLPIIILLSFIVLAYGQRFVKVANNLAELALLNPNDIHTNAFVAGGTVSGDGGGGVFTYNRSSTTTTNDTDVIKPVSYSGRWLRAIPSMNYTNGGGNTYITVTTNISYTTNLLTYFTNSYTTNITSTVANVFNYATNLYVTNLFYNAAQRGTEQITGTNAVVNWTNQFLKRWILNGNSFPVFSNVPTGTNEAQVQVDVVQPAGAAYTITWPGVINWRKNSGYSLLEQDTTNTFIFQWNGENTSGWLVDGDANSAFLASGGLVQRIGTGTDFTMQDDTWVDVTFSSAMSVTITNNGPYAVYYSSQIGAANSQAFYLRLYDGTNSWDGTFSQDTTESVPIPAMRLITTNVTTAPVTLTLQAYNPATVYPNAYVVSTNTVLGYHLLGSGSGGGGITYTTVTNAFSLTTGYLPYATGPNALGDSPLSRQSATNILSTANVAATNSIFHVYDTGAGSASNPAFSMGNSIGGGFGLFRDANGEPSIANASVPVTRFSTDSLRIKGGLGFVWSVGNTDSTPIRQGIYNGTGSPESVLSANTGSAYLNYAGGSGTTLYVKESGSGTSGWIAYSGGSAYDGARSISYPSTALTNIFLARQTAGDIDMWTVPSGYRAAVLSTTVSSTNATQIVIFGQVKVSGTYYQLTATTGATTNAPTTSTFGEFIYEGGDTIALNTTLTGLSIWSTIRYWTNTIVGPYSPRVLGATNGVDYTLYTCPAGKRASGPGSVIGTQIYPRLFGASTTTGMTHTGFIVPSGSSADDSTVYFQRPITVAQGAALTLHELNDGDSIVVRTSNNDAGQSFWMVISEFTP